MSASVHGGPRSWSGSRDQVGYVDYKVKWLVKTTSTGDGPDTVMNASGLPAIGSSWSSAAIPGLNDVNAWAYCWPTCEVTISQEREGEAANWYDVTQTFSTKPLDRCMTTLPLNPTSEPPKVSGSFSKFTREALADRFGNPLLTSSLEKIHGQQVERDFNRASVVIEMNFGTSGLATYTEMIDTVNDATLWGMPPRTIKLSNVKWVRKQTSLCTFFYDVTYEFDVEFEGFDRDIVDTGTRVLLPGGNPFNPDHFAAYKDRSSEPGTVALDGSGRIWTGITGGVNVTGVTNVANPSITTASAHGLSGGEQVIIRGVSGANLVNGVFVVLSVGSPTTFQIPLSSAPGVFSATPPLGQAASLSNATDPGSIHVEFYDESNFLLLGIPSSL